MNLAIDGIDLARSTEANPRLSVDAETVARYAQRIDGLPAITVYRVDGALLVADGLHRIAAAQSLGRTEIAAEIIDGTDRDWREAILRSNQEHGRPWTQAERRCCVGEWLRLYPEHSDNWIGEEAQVSKNTVAAVRAELEATCQIDRLTELVGKDGKTRPRVLAPTVAQALPWVPRGYTIPEGCTLDDLDSTWRQFDLLREGLDGADAHMADAASLQVRYDPARHARGELADSLIDEYRQAMRGGAMFPPVIVEPGGVLIDGAHRWFAAEGLDTVTARRQVGEVVVVTVAGEGAHLALSAMMNSSHGMRLTQADRADVERREAKIAQQEGLLPDLTEDEYQGLKASIAERGVLVPIEIDETGAVLDGHHRLRACEELGITEYPTIIRVGMTEDEKRQHVLMMHMCRRN
jgi:ParB-like chromosome segregation protein Spo0J